MPRPRTERPILDGDHAAMTDAELRTHYRKGCGHEACRAAQAAKQRAYIESKGGAAVKPKNPSSGEPAATPVETATGPMRDGVPRKGSEPAASVAPFETPLEDTITASLEACRQLRALYTLGYDESMLSDQLHLDQNELRELLLDETKQITQEHALEIAWGFERLRKITPRPVGREKRQIVEENRAFARERGWPDPDTLRLGLGAHPPLEHAPKGLELPAYLTDPSVTPIIFAADLQEAGDPADLERLSLMGDIARHFDVPLSMTDPSIITIDTAADVADTPADVPPAIADVPPTVADVVEAPADVVEAPADVVEAPTDIWICLHCGADGTRSEGRHVCAGPATKQLDFIRHPAAEDERQQDLTTAAAPTHRDLESAHARYRAALAEVDAVKGLLFHTATESAERIAELEREVHLVRLELDIKEAVIDQQQEELVVLWHQIHRRGLKRALRALGLGA